MKLNRNTGVTFTPNPHSYFTADGRELGGITPLLRRHGLSPDYDGIPQFILDNAAEYGTFVHSTLEVYDTLGVVGDPICEVYAELVKDFKHVDSEYLVTDGERVASKIDKVFTTDGESVILADVKTTRELHTESVGWQLSIYSYLFRLMNPDIKVAKLYAIWLPKAEKKRPALVEVPTIDDDEIKALLEADAKGEKFVPKNAVLPVVADENALAFAPEFWDFVIEVESKVEELKEAQKEMRSKLLSAMADNDVNKIESDRIIVTRKLASTSDRVDSKLLKEKYPEIYKEVIKTSTTSESILIKIKQ